MLFCQSFALLVPVFILRGLKEFGEPIRKTLIMELAPEKRKAAVFGLYYMLRDMAVALVALNGAFKWVISPAVNLITAFIFGLIGGIGYGISGRDISPDTQQSLSTIICYEPEICRISAPSAEGVLVNFYK